MPVVVRAVTLYVWAVFLFRMMGKALVFQQKPYDFAVLVLIGSASAALIVNREVPLINAMVAMAVLALLHTIISISTLNGTLKRIVGGRPDILVRNGRIVKANLLKNQVNVEQLLAGLRTKGYSRLADIEFAVLEASGQLSVIPKSQARPATPSDLGVATGYEGLATPLIIDGKVEDTNLSSIGLSRQKLLDELAKRKITEPDDVLLALLDTDGSLYIAEQPPVSVIKAFFLGEGKDSMQGR